MIAWKSCDRCGHHAPEVGVRSLGWDDVELCGACYPVLYVAGECQTCGDTLERGDGVVHCRPCLELERPCRYCEADPERGEDCVCGFDEPPDPDRAHDERRERPHVDPNDDPYLEERKNGDWIAWYGGDRWRAGKS